MARNDTVTESAVEMQPYNAVASTVKMKVYSYFLTWHAFYTFLENFYATKETEDVSGKKLNLC